MYNQKPVDQSFNKYHYKLTQEEVSRRFSERGLQLIGIYKNKRTPVEAKCKCENIFLVKPAMVFSGDSRSCGCMQYIRNHKGLINKRFGRLFVVEDMGKNKFSLFTWKCKCDCGEQVIVRGQNLLNGKTRSCGCYKLDALYEGIGDLSKKYYYNLQKRARKSCFNFTISIEYIYDLFIKQNKTCALTGLELKLERNYNKDSKTQTASLDRIDPSLGYIEGNVQWVHKRLNFMKGNMKDKELFEWCKLVYFNNKDKDDYAV